MIISKSLGLLILGGSSIFKMPQIIKILKSKSVEGINPLLYYMESVNYFNIAAYGVHRNLAFTIYGENVFSLVQDIIIIFLIWAYSRPG